MHSNIRRALIFVHGFLGSETSFHSFPQHLQARLPKLECIPFPAYNCRKPFAKVVEELIQFIHFIILETKKRHPQKEFQFILLGHSVGGWIAAEACLLSSLVSTHCLGVLAFDTPFFNLHKNVYPSTQSICRIAGGSGPFRRMGSWLFPCALLSALFGCILYGEFLSPLFSISFEYRCRLIESLSNFRCFYPVVHHSQDTFIQLPPVQLLDYFLPMFTSCTDAITAHTSMFDAHLNASAYGFLLAEVVSFIREWCPEGTASNKNIRMIENLTMNSEIKKKKNKKKKKKEIKIEL